jgi:hypothetical protein
MKKILILIMIINIYSNLFCEGNSENKLVSHYLQLRITNKSKNEIGIYFDHLNYFDKILPMNGSYITNNHPKNENYPGFIAIDRGNNVLEIYKTNLINPVALEWYFDVIIFDDEVDFYQVDNLNNTELNSKEISTRWYKYEINNKNISIEIDNKTNMDIIIGFDGIVGSYHSDKLANNNTIKFEINDSIFDLKHISIRILYTDIIIDRMKLTDYLYLNNSRHKNIKIILNNDSGYEIQYM